MRQLSTIAAAALLAVNVSACASAHHETDSKPQRDPSLITREDIVRSGARDAFEALRLANTHISLSEGRGQMTLTREVQATSRGRSSFILSPQMLLVVDEVQRQQPVEHEHAERLEAVGHHEDGVEQLRRGEAVDRAP